MKTISTSIKHWKFAGINNYLHVFQAPIFRQSLLNIMRIWFLSGAITIFLSLFFAVILTGNIRGKQFFKSVIYMPNVISVIALGNMWLHYVFNYKYGLLKTFFSSLNMTGLASIQWTSPDFIFYAMNIAYSFGMIGYFMLIYVSGIERIPAEILESATIDGAGRFRSFISITFPLLKDVNKTVFTLWTVRVVGFFALSKVFSPIDSSPQTITPMVYAYEAMFGADFVSVEGRIGIAASACVVMTVIIVVMFLLSNALTKGDHYEF
jgi:multiple sugar transport system permease protein